METSPSALLGAGSAIALVGLPLMTTFVEAAGAADPDDIAALNAAIELERAGIKAYLDAAGTKLLSAGVLEVAKGFIADHTAHRDALIAAVRAAGATPSERTARLDYPNLDTETNILRFARTVERKAAGNLSVGHPGVQEPRSGRDRRLDPGRRDHARRAALAGTGRTVLSVGVRLVT